MQVPKTISDSRLLRGLGELVAKSRQDEADLLACIAEVDQRKLYLGQGYSSMHRYCTEVLHFSEATAFHRIGTARASRTYPLLLERVREGALHLSGASLLAPRLTPENHAELLDLARHKSKRAIEELLANRAPKPDVPAQVRKLPDPKTASALRMPAEIFDRALTLLLEDAKRRKFARTARPRARSTASQKPASRHIPAEIKRAVVARDGGRCAFVGSNGRRCGSCDFLEFHHLDPWARAKRHAIPRIELRCRGHNHYAALEDYGAAYMARFAGREHCPRGQSDVKPQE